MILPVEAVLEAQGLLRRPWRVPRHTHTHVESPRTMPLDVCVRVARHADAA